MTHTEQQSLGRTKRLKDLLSVLLADLGVPSLAVEVLCPPERRSYVRAVFALIEGATHGLKHVALGGSAHLEPAERAMLCEEEYSLDSEGRVRTRGARISFLNNVRFTFAATLRSEGVTWTPDYSGQGWEALREAVRVRDRLMHPKVVTDLEVTDEEVANVKRALNWYFANVLLCLKYLVHALSEQNVRLGGKGTVLDLSRLEAAAKQFAS